jgi:hypothetical protein
LLVVGDEDWMSRILEAAEKWVMPMLRRTDRGWIEAQVQARYRRPVDTSSTLVLEWQVVDMAPVTGSMLERLESISNRDMVEAGICRQADSRNMGKVRQEDMVVRVVGIISSDASTPIASAVE